MEKLKKEKRVLFKKSSNKTSTLKPPMFEMLTVIVNRGKGEEVIEFLKQQKVNFNIATFGLGTAPSGIANMFSLYNKEKEVVFAVIKFKDSNQILDLLEENILYNEKFRGFAFTLPLKSMTNKAVERYS